MPQLPADRFPAADVLATPLACWARKTSHGYGPALWLGRGRCRPHAARRQGLAGLPQQRDTNADVCLMGTSGHVEWLQHGAAQTLCEWACRLPRVVKVPAHAGAPQTRPSGAGDQRWCGHLCGHSLCHLLQHAVTRQMAVIVVDVFEMSRSANMSADLSAPTGGVQCFTVCCINTRRLGRPVRWSSSACCLSTSWACWACCTASSRRRSSTARRPTIA